MESSTNALEYIFDCLFHNRPEKVEPVLLRAKQQLTDLYRGLTIVEKRKVTFIKSLLYYLEHEKWTQAKHQLEPAEEEYRKFFLHKIRTLPKQGHYEMHGKEMKSTPNTSATPNGGRNNPVHNGERFVQIEAPGSKRSSANKSGQPQQRDMTKPPSRGQDATKTPSRGSKRGSPTVMKHSMKIGKTDTSKVETTADIVTMFESIYQNEWLAATEELKEFKIDEKSYSEFLLNVVFEAYKLALMEADNQMGRLQTAAYTVLNGDAMYDGPKPKGDLQHLRQYRKTIAAVSIPHLQENFKRRHLPEISRGIGIYQQIRVHGAIDRYTDVVVSACWWMAVHTPTVHICDDRTRLNLFDESMYRYYSRAGISVDFYVWPALRGSEYGGDLLAKGVAEPRLVHMT